MKSLLGMNNDNLIWSGKAQGGDDQGFTYGHYLKIKKITPSGVAISLQYDENLYTQDTGRYEERPDDDYDVYQKTQADQVLKLLFTNKDQGRVFYYSGGIGWQRLDSSGQTSTAQVQKDFHDAVSAGRRPINVAGRGNPDHVLIDADIGARRGVKSGPWTASAVVEGGVRITSFDHASSIRLNSEAVATYQPNSLGVSLLAGTELKLHEQGVERKSYFGFDVHFTKKTKCGIRYNNINGNLMNYQLYNVRNVDTGDIDEIWTTECQHRF